MHSPSLRGRIEFSGGFRRILGLAGSVPLIPALGTNVPLSAGMSLLVLPLSRDRTVPRWLWSLATLALLSAAAVAVSGLVNRTPLATAAIGHALVFTATLAAYGTVIRDTRAASQLTFWFYVGAGIHSLLLVPDARALGPTLEDVWKYGVGVPVTVCGVYLAVRCRPRPTLALLVLSGLGAFAIFLGFRGLGLACLAAAAVTAAPLLAKRRGAIVVALLMLAALAWILPVAIVSGALGESVADRTSTQLRDGLAPIPAGRSEFPLSIAAIVSRPWLGWGNAQTIDSDTLALGVHTAQSWGMGPPSQYMHFWVRSDGFVSLHSVFFSTWVEGGVGAVLFPAALLVLFLTAAVRARGQFAPLIALVAFRSAWDVLFSPWAGHRGTQLAIAAIVCLLALRESAGSDAMRTSRGRAVAALEPELSRTPRTHASVNAPLTTTVGGQVPSVTGDSASRPAPPTDRSG